MFRLISGNVQLTFRPALWLQVRNNKGSLGLPSGIQTNNLGAAPSSNVASNNYNLNPIFTRSNSQSAIPSSTSAKVDSFVKTAQRDSLLRDATSHDYQVKYEHFKDLMQTSNQCRADSNHTHPFIVTMLDIGKLLDDAEIRQSLTTRDLFNFSENLNYCVYLNRTHRLEKRNNRDSDLKNDDFKYEVHLRNLVTKYSDFVVSGEFNLILDIRSLLALLFSMSQYLLYPEMINLWESGVGNSKVAPIYLNDRVLGVILPIAYDNQRFTYEEIMNIFELNTKNSEQVHYELLCSMGKIAISAGDYSRGLDSLESLLQPYESKKLSNYHRSKILTSLGDLHLAFIGSCKDIKIAKHFFDKVIDQDLPYTVLLKTPHIQSLLNNCFELDEPFDSIVYFWKTTLEHYNKEKRRNNLNSRYSILNNTFFSIFFKLYPSLNPESFGKLRELIAIYANIKPIDEVFLNTIISNYSWNDKKVLEQLMENYSIYNVNRTPVSYRICLKKTGEISEYTDEEILEKWNQSLQQLDDLNFNYIPVADWAALRDATILAPSSAGRKNFYLAVVDKYKNYIQNEQNLQRFLFWWSKKTDHFADIRKLSSNEPIKLNLNIEVPQFTHLRPNIDYVKASKLILSGSGK